MTPFTRLIQQPTNSVEAPGQPPIPSPPGPFFPAVGITGLEGRAATVLAEPTPVPRLYNYKRNKL